MVPVVGGAPISSYAQVLEHERECKKNNHHLVNTVATSTSRRQSTVSVPFKQKNSAKYSSLTVPLQFPYSSLNSSRYEKPQFPYFSYYKEFKG